MPTRPRFPAARANRDPGTHGRCARSCRTRVQVRRPCTRCGSPAPPRRVWNESVLTCGHSSATWEAPARRGACGRRRRAALQQRRVDPAAVLETDRLQHAGRLEAERAMQRRRAAGAAVGDHRDHLPPRAGLATFDQRGEQRAADPAPALRIVDVDRILDREAVRAARAVRRRVRVAGHAAVAFGDEVWQPVAQHRVAARAQFGDVGRRFLERRDAVVHVVRIDRVDRIEVGVGRVANDAGGAVGMAAGPVNSECKPLLCRPLARMAKPCAEAAAYSRPSAA